MERKGFTLVELLVVIAIIALLMGILMPALSRVRQLAQRIVCGSILSGIGKAMLIYANDYDDELPRAGGRNTSWSSGVTWDAPDRFSAYGLAADGSGGKATVSSSFYLLVKYAEVTPKSFICKGDAGAKQFKLSDYPTSNVKENINAWDFGPEPRKHCSYSYHHPYGLYALTTASEPGMAVAGDPNPWIDSPSTEAKPDFETRFKPNIQPWNGTTEQARYGNAVTHQGDGQNVLFMDSHVEFEKYAYCGVEDDNVYTFLIGGIEPPQIGERPVSFVSQPGHRKDSLLVHDGEWSIGPDPRPRTR